VSVPVNGPWDLMAVLTGSVVAVVHCFIHFIIAAVCHATTQNVLLQNKEHGILFTQQDEGQISN